MSEVERRILENQVAIMRFLKVTLAYPSSPHTQRRAFATAELINALGETEVILHQEGLNE